MDDKEVKRLRKMGIKNSDGALKKLFKYDHKNGTYETEASDFIFAAVDNPLTRAKGPKRKIEFTKEMNNLQRKFLLTEQELNFCRAYSKYNNLTKAALEAGYNCKSSASANMVGRRIIRRPGVIQYIAKMQENLRDSFEEESKEAFKLLVRFLHEEEDVRITPKLRVEIAKDILDRAGYKATDKIDFSGTVTSTVELESKALQDIAMRARDLLVKANTEVIKDELLAEPFIEAEFKPVKEEEGR